MKTKILSLIAFVSLVFTSCNPEEAAKAIVNELLPPFYLENDATFSVPVLVAPNQTFEQKQEIVTGVSTLLAENKTSTDLVKTVTLDNLKLSITKPAESTFKFAKSISVYIATSEDAPEDQRELLAEKAAIDPTTQEISFSSTNVDLAKYIKSDKFALIIKGTTSDNEGNLTSEILEVKADIKIKITANAL